MCLILILFAAKPYRSAETDGIDCIREKNVSSKVKVLQGGDSTLADNPYE